MEADIKYFLIMRGIAGSGKTALARKLAGEKGKILSLENLPNNRTIKYKPLTPEEAVLVDTEIFEIFCKEIECETPIIILDRTNLQQWVFKKYSQKAQQAGYIVTQVIMPRISAQEAFTILEGKISLEDLQKMVDFRDHKKKK